MPAIVEPGRNCWRTARAERAAFVVDACDYFRIARQAMLNARHRILLIGWDFDARITLERPEDGGHDGETLGSFLLTLAKRNRALSIDILKWDVGALKQLGRGSSMLMLLRWALTKNINFEFDHIHPPGCSHHQKIVVIDDCFAVCGGIDMTGSRWDTREHRDGDKRRQRPGGQPYMPWHDATMLVDGDAAKELAELSRERWKTATGRALEPIEGPCEVWPDAVKPDFTDVEIAIARTRAPCDDVVEVKEIEALFLDMIAAAKHFIYAENQYFTSPKIAEAIMARMKQADPPEIVLIGPITADGWLEQKAMDGARCRLAQAIGAVDGRDRFRIYTAKTTGGEDIYIHAKIMIVDDKLFRVGSANWNNRSLGLDSECDLLIDTGIDGNADARTRIAAIRTELMAEHLGVSPEVVGGVFEETGSIIATIEKLRGQGKTLVPMEIAELDGVEAFIADNELLDPETPSEMFVLSGRRSLLGRLPGRFARKR